MDNIKFEDFAIAQVERGGPNNQFGIGGVFTVEHIRDGKVIGKHKARNTVCTAGKNHMLDVTFDGASPNANWWMSCINAIGYSSTNPADTLTSHAQWVEILPISGSNRPAWACDDPVNGVISNSTATEFIINVTASLKGVFICSAQTGTSGVLFATALFSADVPVQSGDTLRVTYSLTAA